MIILTYPFGWYEPMVVVILVLVRRCLYHYRPNRQINYVALADFPSRRQKRGTDAARVFELHDVDVDSGDIDTDKLALWQVAFCENFFRRAHEVAALHNPRGAPMTDDGVGR
jgi:hypothetical protein